MPFKNNFKHTEDESIRHYIFPYIKYFMQMKNLIALCCVLVLWSCNSDDNAGDVIQNEDPELVQATLTFSQTWGNNEVTQDDFDTTVFTTEIGQQITFNRLRYLLSRIILTEASGDQVQLTAYELIDLSDPSTLALPTSIQLPAGNYSLSMVYGFNAEDNVDGGYTDLNEAIWNWPEMLGGGYHFMQFDGMYHVDTPNPSVFNYHNGTARVDTGIFEDNFVLVDFPGSIEIQENVAIDISMDISEWFKNPYTWDLDVYNTPLMPNYEAQKLIQQNAASVFSATITQ